MERSPSGPNAGADSSGSGSPLAAISGIADKVREKAGERLGSGPGERLQTSGGGPAGATVPAPPFEERPELYVGAAFAGGLALAGFIRLLGR